MRLAPSGGAVPLDLADGDAGDVRRHLCALHTLSVVRRAVVACEQALQTAADLDLESAERLRRQRAWPGTIWRRRAEKRPGVHGRDRLTSGTGTDASTESRIRSGVTPSASAV